jgi:replicative DNA helicase
MKPINIALDEVFENGIIKLSKNKLSLSYLPELNAFDGLIVLTSLQGHGKTSFIQDFILENSVINNSLKGMVLFYGLRKDVFLTRLISKLSKIPIETFFSNNKMEILKSTDVHEIAFAQGKLKKASLLLDFEMDYKSVSDFIIKLRDEIEINAPDYIIIDDLNTLGWCLPYGYNEKEKYHHLFSQLQLLQKEKNIPFIITYHYRADSNEYAENNFPAIYDIPTIIQNTSNIILELHRQDLVLFADDNNKNTINKATIYCLKNNFGKTFTKKLGFVPETLEFKEEV